MSSALASGAFTRTPRQLELERERAHVGALLDAAPPPPRGREGTGAHALATLAALRGAIATASTDEHFTALRVLARHAAANHGCVAPHLQPALARACARAGARPTRGWSV